MRQTIRGEDKNQLLSINEPDYVKYFRRAYRVEPIVFHEDQVYVTEREQMILLKDSHVLSTQEEAPAIQSRSSPIILPFSGESRLLHLSPLAAWFGVWKWSWTTTRSRSISLTGETTQKKSKEKANANLRNTTHKAVNVVREVDALQLSPRAACDGAS